MYRGFWPVVGVLFAAAPLLLASHSDETNLWKVETDDEINDFEIYRAVVNSLNDWHKRRERKLLSKRVKRDEEIVCYGELGCFRDEGPFDYLDMLPVTPEEIGTKYYLHTRRSSSIYTYYNYSSILSSSYNSSNPTKIIIHGFGSNCGKLWVSEMRVTLLAVVDCNVICVDWENGATLPNYVRAAVNTRLVGKQVSLLVKFLNEKTGNTPREFHLIGFSLGAHVAGFAGQELGNLSRITGLDPAGPLYESYDPKVRLDSSDALFVDVIHSNGDSLLMGGLGSWEPMGHIDFYPNGGRVQKGCTNLFLGAVKDFLWSGNDIDGRSLCNHRRAYKFFTESISPRCPFPSFTCESYDKYLTGSCFTWDMSKCSNMGYFADRLQGARGPLYLVTREDEPFCANQYKVRLDSSPSPVPISSYGAIEVILVGHDFINETFLLTQTHKDNLNAGSAVQKIIVAHPAIIEPSQLILKYTAYNGWLTNGISRWSLESIVVTNAYGKSSSFCGRLLLPSGISVTVRLTPGSCKGRMPLRPPVPLSEAYPMPPESTNGTTSNLTSILTTPSHLPLELKPPGLDPALAWRPLLNLTNQTKLCPFNSTAECSELNELDDFYYETQTQGTLNHGSPVPGLLPPSSSSSSNNFPLGGPLPSSIAHNQNLSHLQFTLNQLESEGLLGSKINLNNLNVNLEGNSLRQGRKLVPLSRALKNKPVLLNRRQAKMGFIVPVVVRPPKPNGYRVFFSRGLP